MIPVRFLLILFLQIIHIENSAPRKLPDVHVHLYLGKDKNKGAEAEAEAETKDGSEYSQAGADMKTGSDYYNPVSCKNVDCSNKAASELVCCGFNRGADMKKGSDYYNPVSCKNVDCSNKAAVELVCCGLNRGSETGSDYTDGEEGKKEEAPTKTAPKEEEDDAAADGHKEEEDDAAADGHKGAELKGNELNGMCKDIDCKDPPNDFIETNCCKD